MESDRETPQDLPGVGAESLGECCVTLKVRIFSTGKPVAATSNKRSHWQKTTSCRMRTVASLTFDPLRSKAHGGTSVIERSARNIVADPQETPKACYWIWQVHTVLYSLAP